MRTPEQVERGRQFLRKKYPHLKEKQIIELDEFLDWWAAFLYRMFQRKQKEGENGLTDEVGSDISKKENSGNEKS
jgi:hypothetical protein